MNIIPKKRLRLLIEELVEQNLDLKADVKKALKQKKTKSKSIQISADAQLELDKKIAQFTKDELKRAMRVMLIKKTITLTKDCFEANE
ncbi:MAG: hypothetical protein ACYCS1_05140 [Gammaproteobacteria bacterium]